ncbi:MAG: KH domain-containing protein [Nitrospinota bacterium]|nr:MAG: KH domain-containing protein [Nitrospinota bacterium]
MRALVEQMVRAIVDHPEAVDVKEVATEHTTIIEVRVAREDVGKVIGRQGRNVQAMRTILTAVGAKDNRKVTLEIIED